MECKICGKEVFAKADNKEPIAFMALKPVSADDVRCEAHKSE